jgi:tyrosinase
MANADIANSGIHGRPFQIWGDAPGLEHKLGTSGYCPHSNTLFLGWHRPYLALFEASSPDHVEKEY